MGRAGEQDRGTLCWEFKGSKRKVPPACSPRWWRRVFA